MADDSNNTEKTHHLCKCRECNPISAMAERVDAWKCAKALLAEGDWHEDDKPSVHETNALADWLLYGPQEDSN